MKKLVSLFLITSLGFCLSAQSHKTKAPHLSSVVQMECSKAKGELSFFTAAEDGFLIKWNDQNEGEHFQVTDLKINLISISPNGNDIAIYETDGGLNNRVTVWDWKTLNKKFQKKYNESITSLKFSAKGNYLMVGTASMEGVEFLKTSSWSKENKIQQSANIANYIYTSDSEKTVFFYSIGGAISYYNMQNGTLKSKYNVQKGLTKCILFNSSAFFTGIYNNSIIVYDALKGKLIANIPSNNPIILSSEQDKDLFYLEYDGGSNYVLKKLESNKNELNINPIVLNTFKTPKGYSLANIGFKKDDNIFLGTRNGEVIRYSILEDKSYDTALVTDNKLDRILDITTNINNSDFYFLTKKAIYKSTYEDTVPQKILNNQNQTNFLMYKNNIILWSNYTKNAVSLFNLDTNSTEKLFVPNNIIQNLKICYLNDKAYIIDVESNSEVYLYDLEKKTHKRTYAGIGIQDAIIASDGYLYVSKSASTTPNTPLLKVNIKTLETAPVSITGSIIYSLSLNQDKNQILGLMLNNDNNTYVFSYDVVKKELKNILKFTEEDTQAFTNCYNNNLLTNIGKNIVYSYNVKNKKKSSYKRTASIPAKVCQNESQIIILNDNGSISWCNVQGKEIIADWYITSSEEWFIFN